MFKWGGKDKYKELKYLEMEVTNIFLGTMKLIKRGYPSSKNWLGGKGYNL